MSHKADGSHQGKRRVPFSVFTSAKKLTNHHLAVVMAIREDIFNLLAYKARKVLVTEAVINDEHGLLLAHNGIPWSSEESLENSLYFSTSEGDEGVQGAGMPASCAVLQQPERAEGKYRLVVGSRIDGAFVVKELMFFRSNGVNKTSEAIVRDSSLTEEDFKKVLGSNFEGKTVVTWRPMTPPVIKRDNTADRYLNRYSMDLLATSIGNVDFGKTEIDVIYTTPTQHSGKDERLTARVPNTRYYPASEWNDKYSRRTLMSRKERLARMPKLNSFSFETEVEMENGVIDNIAKIGVTMDVDVYLMASTMKVSDDNKITERHMWLNETDDSGKWFFGTSKYDRTYPVRSNAVIMYGLSADVPDENISRNFRRLYNSPINLDEQVYNTVQTKLGLGDIAKQSEPTHAALVTKRDQLEDIWSYVKNMNLELPDEVNSMAPLVDVTITLTPLDEYARTNFLSTDELDILFLRSYTDLASIVRKALNQMMKGSTYQKFKNFYTTCFSTLPEGFAEFTERETRKGRIKRTTLIPYKMVGGKEKRLDRVVLSEDTLQGVTNIFFRREDDNTYFDGSIPSVSEGFEVSPSGTTPKGHRTWLINHVPFKTKTQKKRAEDSDKPKRTLSFSLGKVVYEVDWFLSVGEWDYQPRKEDDKEKSGRRDHQGKSTGRGVANVAGEEFSARPYLPMDFKLLGRYVPGEGFFFNSEDDIIKSMFYGKNDNPQLHDARAECLGEVRLEVKRFKEATMTDDFSIELGETVARNLIKENSDINKETADDYFFSEYVIRPILEKHRKRIEKLSALS